MFRDRRLDADDGYGLRSRIPQGEIRSGYIRPRWLSDPGVLDGETGYLRHRDAGDERQRDREETRATKFTAFAQVKAFLLKKAAQYDRRAAHRLTMMPCIEELGEAAPSGAQRR